VVVVCAHHSRVTGRITVQAGQAKITKAKKDWRHGSSGKVILASVENPEFNLQYLKKQKRILSAC
jgi:hypothetical protein